MNISTNDIVTSLVSLTAGGMLSSWWNRARPHVLLESFGSVGQSRREVQCSAELSAATKESAHCETVREGTVKLKAVQEALIEAEFAFYQYTDARGKLDGLVLALRSANTDDEIIAARKSLIVHNGTCQAIELLIIKQMVALSRKAYQGSPKLIVD